MFCYQCEQTAKGEGCTEIGVCGKQPDVAALQDLLNYVVKGLSQVAIEGRRVGINDQETNQFTSKAIFSTLTNVDFDPERFVGLINEAIEKREGLKEKISAAGGNIDFAEGPATFKPASTSDALVIQGEKVGIQSDPHVGLGHVEQGNEGEADLGLVDHARQRGAEQGVRVVRVDDHHAARVESTDLLGPGDGAVADPDLAGPGVEERGGEGPRA